MKTLVISPHADDEALGCGVWMQRNECDVVIMALGDYKRYDGKPSNANGRRAEIRKCHDFLNVNKTIILTELDGRLDTVSQSELVGYLDEIMQNEYEAILFPYPSRHIDHQVTYNVTLAALRLRAGKKMESLALMYEYPFITGFDKLGGGVFLQATEKEMESKIHAFELNASQIKERPCPLNADGIMRLAKFRGMECGTDYAEKFYLHHQIL
jgi:LmbE family N-acetylglucosaminyl deacetylase